MSLPTNAHHITEIQFPPTITYLQAVEKVKELSKEDITFEGLVMEITVNGINQRIKIKNPYYLAQHTLAYRGMVISITKIISSNYYRKFKFTNILKCY